jgi:putative oxidoreductase
METIKTYLPPLGRLLLCSLFIWAGIGKLMNPGGTAQAFASHYHVPAAEASVWIAIIVEIVGGVAILVGFWTRWAAAVLALWCLFTAFVYHLPAGDYANMVNFYKNLVMAGGFLFVVAYGPGGLSVDHAMGTEKAA